MLIYHEIRLLNSRDKDGMPIGKQGLHELWWADIKGWGVQILIGVYPVQSNNEVSNNQMSKKPA